MLALAVNVLFSRGSALFSCIEPATQTEATLRTYLQPAVIVWRAGKVLRPSPTLHNSTASLIARLQEDHSALQRERDAFEEEKVGFACNIHSPGRYRRKTVETESWQPGIELGHCRATQFAVSCDISTFSQQARVWQELEAWNSLSNSCQIATVDESSGISEAGLVHLFAIIQNRGYHDRRARQNSNLMGMVVALALSYNRLQKYFQLKVLSGIQFPVRFLSLYTSPPLVFSTHHGLPLTRREYPRPSHQHRDDSDSDFIWN